MSSRPKIKFDSLVVGDSPRVVGVISSLTAFHELKAFPCDLVEVRLDSLGAPEGWLKRCEKIQAAGKPVLLTMRLKNEGGSCAVSDQARLPIFAEAMKLSAVDVELRSRIAREVVEMAADAGKACVISYHDFKKTPPLAELKSIVAEAEALGGVTKIAVSVHSDDDVASLVALLKAPRKKPLCLIGMGENWAHLRVELAQNGSSLAYGYLDRGNAPGQISAAALSAALKLHPGWRVVEGSRLEREYKFADFRQALEFTNKAGAIAEKQNHHPDVFLAWGKVKLAVWTHSAGGLTEKDFAFAAAVDALKLKVA